MLKKNMTYIDYNGVSRTEDFYFNLTRSEIVELELGTTGGYEEMIKGIIAAQDNATLIKIFKELILKSFGKKSPDGKVFNKSEEISTEFANTEAYSDLFMELVTNTESAIAFVNGIIPASAAKAIAADANMQAIIKPIT